MFWEDAGLNLELEQELSVNAFVLVRPAILALLRGYDELPAGPAKRNHLHVIMALRNGQGGECLWEESFNDDEPWEHPYDNIAHGKQRITDRTGLPSRTVQLMERHLLRRGDVKFWGNAIRGPRMVSASGVQAYFDELVSRMVLDAWCALIEHHFANQGDKDPQSSFYPPS